MYRVAWLSPVGDNPFLRSSSFTQALYPELIERYDIEFFHELEEGDATIEAYHFHRLAERNRYKAFDFFVYNYEDHPNTSFLKRIAPMWPGIGIYHDTNFSRLERSEVLYTSAPDEMDRLIVSEFGEEVPSLGQYHVRKWPLEIFDSMFPLGRKLLSDSVAAVCFSEASVDRFRQFGVTENVFTLPEVVTPRPVIDGNVSQARRQGSGRESVVLSTSAGVSPCESLELCVLATEELAQMQNEKIVLEILFSSEEDRERVQRVCELYAPEASAEYRLERVVSREQIIRRLVEADIFLSLGRDGTRGIPQAAWEAMSVGTPTIFHDTGEVRELPASVAFRVKIGDCPLEELCQQIVELISSSELSGFLASSAKSYVSEHCSAAGFLNRFDGILASCRDAASLEMSKVRGAYLAGRNELIEELKCGQAESGDSAAGVLSQEWTAMIDQVVKGFSWSK